MEKLVLRPFSEQDAEDVFEYLRESEVKCFVCMKLASVEEAKREMLRRKGEREYYFAIVLKETGKVIGDINVFLEGKEKARVAFQHLLSLVNDVLEEQVAEAKIKLNAAMQAELDIETIYSSLKNFGAIFDYRMAVATVGDKMLCMYIPEIAPGILPIVRISPILKSLVKPRFW